MSLKTGQERQKKYPINVTSVMSWGVGSWNRKNLGDEENSRRDIVKTTLRWQAFVVVSEP